MTTWKRMSWHITILYAIILTQAITLHLAYQGDSRLSFIFGAIVIYCTLVVSVRLVGHVM